MTTLTRKELRTHIREHLSYLSTKQQLV